MSRSQRRPSRILWVSVILLLLCSGFSGVASAAIAPVAQTSGAVFHAPLGTLPRLLDHLLRETHRLRAVVTGPQDAAHLTVFFDPDCPFCARFWQTLWPRHRDYRIRWIPVAYARPDSNRVAAAILLASDPQAALVHNEEGFHFRQHHGGLMPIYHLPPDLAKAIANNSDFWRHWFGMLPVFFYRSTTGVHLFVGRPTSTQWRHVHQVALP